MTSRSTEHEPDVGDDTRAALALADCLGLAVGNVALDKTGTVEKRALGFLALIALRERRVTPREVSMLEHGAGNGHGSGMGEESKNKAASESNPVVWLSTPSTPLTHSL
jgi:hypothetical protein